MKRPWGLVLTLVMIAMFEPTLTASSREHARSMVVTQRGIVAASQTLASQAGAQILARGGSAADAAIAANAVLTVVEPMSNGIGGDLFAIRRDAATGEVTGLNASGWAPAKLTAELLRNRGHDGVPRLGILSATVPGCVRGWAALHQRFGRLPWREVLQPAIYYAEHGFPVTEIIQEDWTNQVSKLSADDYAKAIFLPNGQVPRVGEVFRNPDLAKALRLLAAEGADAFYEGEIARAILATSSKLEGVFSAEDLAAYEAEWVEPVTTDYRGWKVYELPPNGQGIAALEMLNIMERFPLGEWRHDEPDTLHCKIEAQKLAYQDLQRYVGDPRFARMPLDGLLSKDYAGRRAARLKPDRAACDVAAGDPPGGSSDTIYLSAVDRDGNLVSLIQSIYNAFGSGVAVPGYGFHLQNRGALFTLEEGHPNELQPRKRPFHTIIPALMERGARHVAFGIMGGYNQAQAHAQFVSNVADHGMNLQQALEAPRFTKLTFGGCDLMIESRFPEATLEQLRERGHELTVPGPYCSPVGGGQAVMLDSDTGVKYGASSPRKDGAAVPEPDPYFAAK